MKKLPIGIQHFPFLIQDNYTYVDKTKLIYQLIHEGRGHFLARPRRFGKSLLLSTFATLFQGKKDFFSDTWIYGSDYAFDAYPTLILDFSTVSAQSIDELRYSLNKILEYAAEDLKVSYKKEQNPKDSFISLIRNCAKEKEVVILIDEYDAPLVSQFDREEHLEEIRKEMRDFFVVIKSLGAFIRYAFVTGVSKFSKVSLFSGMNNLIDISLHPEYATVTGITETELKLFYQEWIRDASKRRQDTTDHTKALMRQWYNGYRFSGNPSTEKVYNPVSVHLFLTEARLSNFWFGTATPTFAIKLIQKLQFPITDFEKGIKIGASLDEHHEVLRPDLIPLLFQTGYLTIKDFDEATSKYQLNFPNEEVRLSFLNHLLRAFTQFNDSEIVLYEENFKKTLTSGNLEEFFKTFNQLLAERMES